MKNLIIYLFLVCLVSKASAQVTVINDATLKFDQRYTKCERKWVVMSKADTASKYIFGYIYVDGAAGFTFDLKGDFRVDKHNKYIVDTTATKNSSIKYRIAPNWRPVAMLPPQHFEELNIKAEPYWVKIYYNYTDTVKHNFRWGFIYNDVGESGLAIPYLEMVYKVNPHYPGLEFEMAFAYNALNDFDAAIKLIEPAIQNDPGNAYYYKELGYAYSHKKLFEKAIDTYKRGLEHSPAAQSESKGELAFNMADAYRNLGNQDEYKNWMIKAKAYTPTTSMYYKRITDAGF